MSNKTFLLYAISALSVLALAAFYPRTAALLVGILILGVLAQHGTEYADLLNAASGHTGEKKK